MNPGVDSDQGAPVSRWSLREKWSLYADLKIEIGPGQKLYASIEFLTRAKNRLRGQKSRNVFHIASQKNFKAKNKAKLVTTNLLILNIMNDEKANRVNKAFVNVQKELAHFSKRLSLEPLQKELIPQQYHESKPVNVGEATKLMAQL
ncbi:ribosomal biogenesis factor-like [Trachypithecus francoisi]|uniref:ribosomal biogenesis factor-like n=1 Tax=Trachypithecus francoisi TaxID=54180 RepID=UPI00141B4170|nr:ribosomal biogenesis factor-like [Trachypithecus francoisi]